jgi:hypothetical protein
MTQFPEKPSEFDAAQAELEYQWATLAERIWRIRQSIEDISSGKYYSYKSDAAKASMIEEYEKDIAKVAPEEQRLLAEIEAMRAEFRRRGGWKRYFLVVSSDGHVHRGTHCSTCFSSTRFAWLTELSDCDEDAMVEQYGEKACTVCFPDAPTHPAWARSIKEREEAEAKKNANVCSASGEYVSNPTGRMYIPCPKCGKYVKPTKYGELRKHKLPS